MPLAALLTADWSKSPSRRAVYAAHVATRTVRRVPPPSHGWTLASLLQHAEPWRPEGAVVIAVDAPLGVPAPYLAAARAALALPDHATFLDLLAHVPADYFHVATAPEHWSLRRPFFAVPKGPGGLTQVLTRAGGTLRRRVDVATGAKSPFIASGIPGSVGSSAIALWQELRALGEHPRLAVWPFHGTLAELTREPRLVLAETYPRACGVPDPTCAD